MRPRCPDDHCWLGRSPGCLMKRAPHMSRTEQVNWPRLLISIAIPQAAGGLGAIATQAGLKEWYPSLEKPSFNPPGAVFGPVWTTLYLLMGIAEHLVSTGAGDGAASRER